MPTVNEWSIYSRWRFAL